MYITRECQFCSVITERERERSKDKHRISMCASGCVCLYVCVCVCVCVYARAPTNPSHLVITLATTSPSPSATPVYSAFDFIVIMFCSRLPSAPLWWGAAARWGVREVFVMVVVMCSWGVREVFVRCSVLKTILKRWNSIYIEKKLCG